MFTLTEEERAAAALLTNSGNSILSEKLQTEISLIIEKSDVNHRKIEAQNIEARRSKIF